MLKYVNTEITFLEVPDEITLCINISNCPCHCKGCHSSYLAEDIGNPLIEYPKGYSDDFIIYIDELIEKSPGISCVSIMGGDSDPTLVNVLASYLKDFYPDLKVAWYSGRQELSKYINLKYFDFIKLGPYIEEYGPLNSKTTNQRMYKAVTDNYEDGTSGYELIDITNKFWK